MDVQPLARLKTGVALVTPFPTRFPHRGYVDLRDFEDHAGGFPCGRSKAPDNIMNRGVARGKAGSIASCHALKCTQPAKCPITVSAGGERDHPREPGAAVGVLERHILGVHAEEPGDERRRQQTRGENQRVKSRRLVTAITLASSSSSNSRERSCNELTS